MESTQQACATPRYRSVAQEKAAGATYTPKILADFVAKQITDSFEGFPSNRPLRVLDPAVGHGELLISLLGSLTAKNGQEIEVYGFDTNPEASHVAQQRIQQEFPSLPLHFRVENFLDFTVDQFLLGEGGNLFRNDAVASFDMVIANPPYVRAQVMGAKQAQRLAKEFGLSGRIDLYYAFVLGILRVLGPQGIAGMIVSNRFMTTRSGASVRQALLRFSYLLHAWDLGDTKLFDAAVLPAVLLVKGKHNASSNSAAFTSIYETADPATRKAANPIASLDAEGVVEINDGRHFRVRKGKLRANGMSDGVWRIAIDEDDAWLASVDQNRWGAFGDVGKIRVGVKTCADRVFVRDDWHDMPDAHRPELLRPLTTHHAGRRFRAMKLDPPKEILYAHEAMQGRCTAVDLARYPRSLAYLQNHRETLEARQYLIEAGRKWYEIWVPQNPESWSKPKLVFRDIAETPTFWMDFSGSVVNGDCYWLTSMNGEQTDLLWLASAVGNSTLAERYYDLRFNNKLYAGRRRFMKQYVEQFPLPDPYSPRGKALIAGAKKIYEAADSHEVEPLFQELDALVWETLTGQAKI